MNTKVDKEEAHKAWLDLMCYGTSMVRHNKDGTYEHIPVKDIDPAILDKVEQ